MTLQEFRPENCTSLPNDFDRDEEWLYSDERLDRILFYRSDISGIDGAHYQLFKEKHHTQHDVVVAKKYLRSNFDVLSIKMVFEK